MTTPHDTVRPAPSAAAALQPAIEQACTRIAPTWPLDRFIAVNPYWGHLERPVAAAAAQLAALSGSPMLMSREGFQRQWQAGQVGPQHLQAAITAAGSSETVETLLASLQSRPALPSRLPLATDLVDAHRDLGHAMAWRDYITHHISQCCAAFFDQGQAAWGPDRTGGLYPSWLRQSAHDLGPGMLMGYPGFSARLARLPDAPQALIAAAMHALQIPAAAHEAYFTALLMSINGWASWCAYQRWQARLEHRDDEQIVHLLAVRLAWEWMLHEGHGGLGVAGALAAAWGGSQACIDQAQSAQQTDWLWQAALERSTQEPLCQGLHRAPAVAGDSSAAAVPPAVQAVFCIDVRSEVYRRALEASSPAVQTLGFAGFFAMFVAYQPLGSEMKRPQLPGLLAPGRCITDECDAPGLGQALARQRRQKLLWRQQWQAFRSGAGSSFSFVESCGLLFAGKLIKSSLGGEANAAPVEQTGFSAAQRGQLRPRFPAADGPDLEAGINAAAAALGAMGLTADHARLVLLAGHGSSSANNPHAAGLDCGACGGQTGEVNARALALLLNEPKVRQGLRARGVSVPESTWFLAGLHNTTTDA
ncbi:MAG: putative inorganic carbon transporter subunit DabA, partial [Ramlibacter sp.]